MLFRQKFLDGIRDGTITLVFRRWRRPSVRAGGTLLTPVGQLGITSVGEVAITRISEADARSPDTSRATSSWLNCARTTLERFTGSSSVRCVRIHAVASRQAATLADRERDEIDTRLQRLDARAADGPWTARTLDVIRTHPGVRAGDLCRLLGQEKLQLKLNVRKLKALGLTESLETGYRLSPRGVAFIRFVESED